MRQDRHPTIISISSMGYLLRLVLTTVMLALAVSTSVVYQTAADLLCLSVSESLLIQEHSAVVAVSVLGTAWTGSRLIAVVSTIMCSASHPRGRVIIGFLLSTKGSGRVDTIFGTDDGCGTIYNFGSSTNFIFSAGTCFGTKSKYDASIGTQSARYCTIVGTDETGR